MLLLFLFLLVSLFILKIKNRSLVENLAFLNFFVPIPLALIKMWAQNKPFIILSNKSNYSDSINKFHPYHPSICVLV